MKRLQADDLKRGMLVEERMANNTWARARVVAIMKRKTHAYPYGRVVLDVLRNNGDVECRDEVGIPEVGKYLRRTAEEAALAASGYVKVDLINASPQLFCETLFLAAKIGVTDTIANQPARSAHELAALLCQKEKYRYEHVNMLFEAYESGQMFMDLRGKPTDMTWGTTTDSGWKQTEHGRYKVRVTKGNGP